MRKISLFSLNQCKAHRLRCIHRTCLQNLIIPIHQFHLIVIWFSTQVFKIFSCTSLLQTARKGIPDMIYIFAPLRSTLPENF